MAKGSKKSKKATRVAPAKLVSLDKRAAGKKGSAKRVKGLPRTARSTATDTPRIPPHDGTAAEDATALARIGQLEADRTNLMAQVAWARAVAQEQQKTLEVERERAEKLAADLEAQRGRVEQLKALSLLDRLLGRHKAI